MQRSGELKSMKAVAFILIGIAVGYIAATIRERGMANIEAYAIGFEQGQADGISTAAAAYESGGMNAVIELESKEPQQ